MIDWQSASEDLTAWLCEQGLSLDQRQQDLFKRLLAQYESWLPKLNFTAIKEPREFVVKHLVDSLAPLKLVSWEGVANLLDVGSGGGFPGVPLGIMLSQLPVTLLEATGKKVTMLQAIIAELAFGNIRVIQGRAEEYGHNPGLRETFDLVTTRALGAYSIMLELALPFVRVGGRLLAYQGPKVKTDLAVYSGRLAELGGEVAALHHYSLPFGMGERVLVEIRKNKNTLAAYPRRVAIIRRRARRVSG